MSRRPYAAELLPAEVPVLDDFESDEDADDFESDEDDVVELGFESAVDDFDDDGELLDEEPRLSLR